MAVDVVLRGRDESLARTNRQVAKSAGEIDQRYRDAARASQRMASQGRTSFRQLESASERYRRELRGLIQLQRQGEISAEQFGRARDRLRTRVSRDRFRSSPVGQAIQDAQRSILTFGAAGAAVAAVTTATNAWFDAQQRVNEAVRESLRAETPFLLLQQAQGANLVSRGRQAAGVGAAFGQTDRGVIFDTVQSLQSGLGDFNAGLRAAADVFSAELVGIPGEFSKELAGQAIVANPGDPAAVGRFLQSAFIAGQTSLRDPALIARAASALPFIEAPEETQFAALGVLAGRFGNQLETFARRAGIALGESGLDFRQFGLAQDAGFVEKLQALADAGFDTTAELKNLGLANIREAAAVETLVNNIQQLVQIQTEIAKRQDPGLLIRERLAAEASDRRLELDRLSRESQARFQEARVRPAEAIQERDIRTRELAAVLERRGIRSGIFGQIADEEGRIGALGFLSLITRVDPFRLTSILNEASRDRPDALQERLEEINSSVKSTKPAPVQVGQQEFGF